MERLILFVWAFLACTQAQALDIYGHRGAAGLAPENTLEAYRTAIQIGVDVIDMDVGLTQDGQVVVYHNMALNPDITRSADGQWFDQNQAALKQISYSDLKKFNVGGIN